MAYPGKTSTEAILAAAVATVERQGLDALSLRGLAQVLGLTPNALYRYLSSREALVGAVADHATKRLLDRIEAARVKTNTAQEGVRAVAEAYLSFAKAEPHLYALVSLAEQKPLGGEPAAHLRLWTVITEVMEGLVGRDNAGAAAVTVWGYLHGMVELGRSDLLGAAKPDAALWGLDVLIDGLSRQREP